MGHLFFEDEYMTLEACFLCGVQALIRLLRGAMYSRCKSIIVYCTRREQTARVATLIRTQMKDFYGDDSDDDTDEDGSATPPRKKKGAKGAFTWSCYQYYY